MHIVFPHKTSKQVAISKVKEALTQHRAELAKHASITKEEWGNDSLDFAVDLQGKTITGTLAVTDTDYILDAKLPLMWRMFEGRIEREVEKQIQAIK
jgi:hypothetical protein